MSQGMVWKISAKFYSPSHVNTNASPQYYTSRQTPPSAAATSTFLCCPVTLLVSSSPAPTSVGFLSSLHHFTNPNHSNPCFNNYLKIHHYLAVPTLSPWQSSANSPSLQSTMANPPQSPSSQLSRALTITIQAYPQRHHLSLLNTKPATITAPSPSPKPNLASLAKPVATLFLNHHKQFQHHH
ncbi:hypothetical protein M0R45_013930 [Rubus argutus]|uniref:Uncharacterized protein n=1 Tax=Rubus argutus TaxID=59490 RepID=A0AAW1XL98_RUBAR